MAKPTCFSNNSAGGDGPNHGKELLKLEKGLSVLEKWSHDRIFLYNRRRKNDTMH